MTSGDSSEHRAHAAAGLRGFFERLRFPALVLLLGVHALRAPDWDLARALGAPPGARVPLLLLTSIAAFYPLIALLEVLRPFRREWRRPHGDRLTDALHLALTGPLAQTLFDLTLRSGGVLAAGWLAQRSGFSPWPHHWPDPARLVLALAVAEFGHYWFHRISHEAPLVWRLHAPHHSAQRLYWLNATRFHPLDLFALLACQILPLLLLGIDERSLLSYTIFTAVYGQIQHCNTAVPTRALDWIFATPRLHRWHHAIDPREGNHNYGAVLSGWDLLFGSFLRPADREAPATLGIEGRPDFPRGYLGQLLSPFRGSRQPIHGS